MPHTPVEKGLQVARHRGRPTGRRAKPVQTQNIRQEQRAPEIVSAIEEREGVPHAANLVAAREALELPRLPALHAARRGPVHEQKRPAAVGRQVEPLPLRVPTNNDAHSRKALSQRGRGEGQGDPGGHFAERFSSLMCVLVGSSETTEPNETAEEGMRRHLASRKAVTGCGSTASRAPRPTAHVITCSASLASVARAAVSLAGSAASTAAAPAPAAMSGCSVVAFIKCQLAAATSTARLLSAPVARRVFLKTLVEPWEASTAEQWSATRTRRSTRSPCRSPPP